MSTSTSVNNLVINKLTKAQYDAIQNPDPTQLYLIIDDTEYAEASDLPQPSNTTPNIDGVGNAGVSATYARGDHTHPAELPSQTGNGGKYLTTDGNTTSWSSLGTVLNYKGTKATIAALPSSGNVTGDVWIVTANNSEHAWNGSAWEELGPTIDLSGYAPLNSPVFIGTPTAPTPTSSSNNTQIATKEYVDAIIVEPEDDENIIDVLSSLGLGVPLNDGNDIVVDDNDLALLVPNEIYVTTGGSLI